MQPGGVEVQSALVAVVSGEVDHKRRLQVQLSGQSSSIASEQLDKLRDLVGDFHDVFTLSEDDLILWGTRLLIGDHAPIKQYPRCTPFIQYAKVATMVVDMEKRHHMFSQTRPSNLVTQRKVTVAALLSCGLGLPWCLNLVHLLWTIEPDNALSDHICSIQCHD